MVREKNHPWGLPDLPEHEQSKVDQGNRCLQSSLQIIRCLNIFSIPWAWENPLTSRMWLTPQAQAIECLDGVNDITCDFCMMGTPWRKRTRIRFGSVCRRSRNACTDEMFRKK
eukprot:2381076-Pyramimonas_sp.AAC.1